MAKSEYNGYVGGSPKGRAESASKGFSQNYENMRTDYETYKKKGDPSSKNMQDSLRVGNEGAAAKLHQALHEADAEKYGREYRRARDAMDKRSSSASEGKTRLDTTHNKN